MKITEKRWMHTQAGRFADRGLDMSNKPDYELVTVVRDVPEWEEVEVVRWVVVNTSDKSECFTSHSEKMCEDLMKNVREPEKLNIVRLSNTYRRRKPEPEAWEGTTKRSVSGNVAIIHLSSEWIHKRVRVEVIEEAREK